MQEVCEDTASSRWCSKKQGKCKKGSVRTKCKRTCQQCSSAVPTPAPVADPSLACDNAESDDWCEPRKSQRCDAGGFWFCYAFQ